jgi:hypothetical protein
MRAARTQLQRCPQGHLLAEGHRSCADTGSIASGSQLPFTSKRRCRGLEGVDPDFKLSMNDTRRPRRAPCAEDATIVGSRDPGPIMQEYQRRRVLAGAEDYA